MTDDDLREPFRRLREAERRAVPPFRVATRRGRPWRLAFAAALLLVVIGVGLLTRTRPQPAAPAASLSTWRAPTDFLLRTPGRELVNSTPRLKPEIPRRTFMRRHTIIAITLFLSLASLAAAQQQPQPPQDDPIGRYLFPPELIMAHAQDLGLQDKQRETIKEEVQKAQGKFFDYQWQAKEETDKMVKLLQQSPADETKILEQADRVMNLERQIKKTHLTLLIHLRNLLTTEQQARLQQFR